jgi:hypothetical protein
MYDRLDGVSKIIYSLLIVLTVGALTASFITAGPASPPVLYVGYVGNPGDTAGTTTYTCTGTASSSTDNTVITNALAYVYANKGAGYTTVYLKGPHTYYVAADIVGPNTGITLTGDSTAVLTYTTAAEAAGGVNLIDAVDSANHITISKITLDGAHPSMSYLGGTTGSHPDILMQFNDVSYLYLTDLTLRYGDLDGANIRNSDHIYVSGCTGYELGHDVFYFLTCTDIYVWDNTIRTRTNSAVRLSDGIQRAYVHDNVFYSVIASGYTGPLMEIHTTAGSPYFNTIEVYNNKFYNNRGAGMWIGHGNPGDSTPRMTNIYIHHNTFSYLGHYPYTGYSNAGIDVSNAQGTRIENNVFDDCGYGAVLWAGRTADSIQTAVQFTTYVRNNIIMNCANTAPESSPVNWGYGIENRWTNNRFIVENNCFYNNVGLTYGATGTGGFTMTNNIEADPRCAVVSGDWGARDYHLRSTAGRWTGAGWVLDSVSSPCIDAGYASSSYSLEPAPNGGRINIGRYGNTIEASKTPGGVIPEEPEIFIQYDARIKSSTPDDNFGSLGFLDIGEIASASTVYRHLIWFNLSEYEPDDIGQAYLKLYWYYPYPPTTRNNDTIIDVYKVSGVWKEDEVTWNSRETGSAWAIAGGTWFDADNTPMGTNPYASYTIQAEQEASNAYILIDVTNLTKELAEDNNRGYLLKARTESDNYIGFYSMDNGNPDRVPLLTISAEAAEPVMIANFTPIDTTPEGYVGYPAAFSVETTANGTVTWYKNGLVAEIDYVESPVFTANYTFTPTEADVYGIEAVTADDEITWLYTAEEPVSLTIIATSPYDYINLIVDDPMTFTAETSTAANYTWTYNGIEGKTTNETLSDSYTWGVGQATGFYNVMVAVEAGGEYDEYIWHVQIISETPEPEAGEYQPVLTGYIGTYTDAGAPMNYTTPFTLSQNYSSVYLSSVEVNIDSTDNKYMRARGLGPWSQQWNSLFDNPLPVPYGEGNLSQIEFTAFNLSNFTPSIDIVFTETNLTTEETRASGQLNVSITQEVLLDSDNGTIFYQINDDRYNNVTIEYFDTDNINAEISKDSNGLITIVTGPQATDDEKYYDVGFSIPPLAGFEYWDGEMWYTGEALDYLFFDAFWWANLVPNYAQTYYQPTLKITNVGEAAGDPVVYLDRNTTSTIKIWVDNDPIKNGDSIQLTATPQTVGTELQPGENVTLWAWAGLYGAEDTQFSLFADVV